jgi:methylphosphotriester-DNA--protein-cysteine methyltransferase
MYYRHNGRVHHMHRHSELEMNLVTRGRATYLMFDGRRTDIASQTMLWLFPEQDHILINPSHDFEMWVVVFRPTMVRRWTHRVEEYRVLSHPKPPKNFSRRLNSAVASRLDALLQELASAMSRPGEQQRFNSGLTYAMLSAWRAFLDAEESPDADERIIHPAVEMAARIVRDEVEPCGIDELAQRCGTSTSHLSRMFKRQTGVTLVNYRQKMCVERFLRNYHPRSDLNMLQSALDAGFGSYPQFHRIFKQHMKRSPAEYRREILDQPPAKALKQRPDSRALARQ